MEAIYLSVKLCNLPKAEFISSLISLALIKQRLAEFIQKVGFIELLCPAPCDVANKKSYFCASAHLLKEQKLQMLYILPT